MSIGRALHAAGYTIKRGLRAVAQFDGNVAFIEAGDALEATTATANSRTDEPLKDYARAVW